MTNGNPGVSPRGESTGDWLYWTGYLGGVALAVGLEVLDPPLALVALSVPLLRLLGRPSRGPVALAGRLLEGIAMPFANLAPLPPPMRRNASRHQAEVQAEAA